ncbi:MAG TPA: GDP-mannose 4,6-dehydratase [Aquella sp.]|nr:GDP-mannose 4,6-dehydratase [Aquella sp.]
MFNHESYLRSANFFMKKVLTEAIKIKKGQSTGLLVGNIDIKRDFGYAPFYVEGMYLMMQSGRPGDFILCSGQSMSLRNIIEYVFRKLEIENSRYRVNSELYRPADIDDIFGNSDKARRELGWNYLLSGEELLDKLLEEELLNWKN